MKSLFRETMRYFWSQKIKRPRSFNRDSRVLLFVQHRVAERSLEGVDVNVVVSSEPSDFLVVSVVVKVPEASVTEEERVLWNTLVLSCHPLGNVDRTDHAEPRQENPFSIWHWSYLYRGAKRPWDYLKSGLDQ